MPRGPRISFDNALFHIINRGNARQEIFHEELDLNQNRSQFIQLNQNHPQFPDLQFK